MRSLIRYAWFVLAFNVVVILGGALVRATGSGAGCGRSWPTCQGVILPELEGATAIEFAHRFMSGLALILVFVLVFRIWRSTSAGDIARTGAVLSAIAIVVEALIGAMIVLAEWVADDSSVARVVAVPLHLVNTLFLLAALTLTIFWLSGGDRLNWKARPQVSRGVIVGGVALVLLAATGAVTALADTLYPVSGEDFIDEAHFLTRLRIIHPILAVVLTVSAWWAVSRRNLVLSRRARMLPVLIGLMMLTGVVNITLGVPVAMQLVHLAVADILWIVYVWLSAELLAEPAAVRSSPSR